MIGCKPPAVGQWDVAEVSEHTCVYVCVINLRPLLAHNPSVDKLSYN